MDTVNASSDLRGALVGAMISAGFGLGWSQWGASGLSGGASSVVRVAGIVVGAVILLWCAWLWSTAPGEAASRSMFSSRSYRLIVAFEVVAIIGGNALLGAIGHSGYIIAWVATVVGIHFLAFARLFWGGFRWLGAALITAGIAGAVVGFASGRSGAIEATSGLIAAASLFVAGALTIVRAGAGTPG
jgi:hypothetical protein